MSRMDHRVSGNRSKCYPNELLASPPTENIHHKVFSSALTPDPQITEAELLGFSAEALRGTPLTCHLGNLFALLPLTRGREF